MRLKLTVSAAATAALVLAAGLGAASADPAVDGAVKVYGNSFSSQGAMKQLIRVRRSGNTCTRAFNSAGKMKITIGNGSTKECAYDPLVIGGPDQAGSPGTVNNNLQIEATGRLSASGGTAERRERTFVGVSIRDGENGNNAWYLAVFPGAPTPRWEVWRKAPSEGSCTIIDQGTTDVEGLSTDNTLRLRVFPGDVSAKINGGTTVGLPDVGEFDPERTAVLIGVASNDPRPNGGTGCPTTIGGGAKDVTGNFDSMQVSVPDPKPDINSLLPTDDVKEKGKPSGSPTPPASCPSSPCEAIGKLTGYQTQIQRLSSTPKTNPFGMTQSTGKLIAWRLTLGDPNATQTNFFEEFFDSGPRAGVGVLRKQPPYSNRFELVRRMPGVDLKDQYFGHRITVAPSEAQRINQDMKVGMIVGTWAPAFATGISSSNTWRATREEGFPNPDVPVPTAPPPCSPGAGGINFKNGKAHDSDNTYARYKCNYDTARLMYTALIAVP